MISANEDTIVALATPSGTGAIALIRLSGPNAVTIINSVFKGKNLEEQDSHTIHFGTIRDGEKIIDEVLVSLFIAPKSYTKENVTEISCHGSKYIIDSIIKLLIKKGARAAKPGEFTLRAFLNGGLDLSQAEAVADLISSESQASHQLAIQQMRGGFSNELKQLREQLIHFASMIELELDFSEEDVEFANRDDLRILISRLLSNISNLIRSFELGNVIKNGVPVVIAGKPNVGKSTLLNVLLNEERAIVSDIAGTTRDTIEDEVNIKGIVFRFIDTAGIRETQDIVEAKGVERTFEKIKTSAVVLYLFDASENSGTEFEKIVNDLQIVIQEHNGHLILVCNKVDLGQQEAFKVQFAAYPRMLFISAKEKLNIQHLEDALLEAVNIKALNSSEVIISSLRHHEALLKTAAALERVLFGIDNPVTSDFLALDIKQALYYLGEITGQVTTDDLLENIFSKFCIGK